MSSAWIVVMLTEPPMLPATALPIEGPFSIAMLLMKSGSMKVRLLVP